MEQATKKLGYTSRGNYQGMAEKPSYVQAYELAGLLMQEFVEKQIDRVELIYHHFKSMGAQILTREEYLPIDLSKVEATAATEGSGKRGFQNDYIVATDNANELIQDLTKQYNKSRQQAITNELLDIIAGSLK